MSRENAGELRKLRRGLTLLEVLLAIAILGITAAILAQIIQLGTENALESQDSLQANLIAESQLAELAAAQQPLQPVNWTNVVSQTASAKQWFYRLEVVPTSQPNIMSVTVYVGDEFVVNNTARPTAKLTRWFVDSTVGLDTPAAPADTTGTGI